MLKIIASSSSSDSLSLSLWWRSNNKTGYILDNNGNKLEQFREKKTGINLTVRGLTLISTRIEI